MEIRELLGKVEKLINEQKLPQEVKDLVNGIYLEYNNACKKFLSNIQLSIENDEKNQTELNNIADYINRDFEDDKSTSDEIEQTSYLIKLEHMLENIQNVMNNMVRNREINNVGKELPPIIDVEELTEEQKIEKEKIRENETIKSVTTDMENMKCAIQIKESVISEIESSKEALIMKLSSIKSKQDFIEYSKEQFLNEVELIKNTARLKLIPEIKEILDAQDNEIKNAIIDIYDQYRKEEKPLTGREKFASNIHAEVNVEEAVKKVQEESEKEIKIEENTFGDLPGNEIR